jgi:hypothetical protein
MEKQVLTKEDIITIVKYLIEIMRKQILMILITYQTVVLEQLENNCLNNSVLV